MKVSNLRLSQMLLPRLDITFLFFSFYSSYCLHYSLWSLYTALCFDLPRPFAHSFIRHMFNKEHLGGVSNAKMLTFKNLCFFYISYQENYERLEKKKPSLLFFHTYCYNTQHKVTHISGPQKHQPYRSRKKGPYRTREAMGPPGLAFDLHSTRCLKRSERNHHLPQIESLNTPIRKRV